jgi:hypothetical protein
MTREWRALVAGQVAPDATPTPGAVADAMVATVGALRDNELFTRIVDLDPELILPYLFARRGRSQELVIAALEAAVSAGQAAGSIRSGNQTTIARSLVLAAHGFVLSAHTMLDDAVTQAALDRELHALVTRSLTP